MKKPIIAIITATLLFISYSCQPGKDNASIEPNDEIDQANTIDLNTEFSMAIYPQHDIDWYEVEVPGQGYLQVLVRDVPDLTLVARLATYDEWGEQKENYLTGRRKTPCAMHIFEEGTYFIKMRDYTQYADAYWLGGQYSKYSEEEFYVKFNFVEEFDPNEPNYDVENAVKAEFEKEYESAIYPRGDQDWFKVNVEEQGYLQVQARNVSDDLSLRVHFADYDEYRSEPVQIIRDKESLPTAMAVVEPGDYYIVLSDDRDRNESMDLFNWKVNFIAEMDNYEPNDCFTQATEIGVNDTIKIAIFPKGDKDFFRINPEEAGVLRVMSRGHGDIEPTVALFAPDPDDPGKLTELKSKTRIPTDLKIEEAGKYFIKISDRRHRNESQDLFDILLRFE